MTVWIVVVESEGERGVCEHEDRRSAMAHCEAAEVRGVDRAAVMAVSPDGEGGHVTSCIHAFERDPVSLTDWVIDQAGVV